MEYNPLFFCLIFIYFIIYCHLIQLTLERTKFLLTFTTSDKLWKKEVIKNDIYKFEESEKILRAENKVYNYKKPTISPFYYAESFDIWIGVSFYDQEKTVEDYEPEGLIFNEKALVANMNNL